MLTRNISCATTAVALTPAVWGSSTAARQRASASQTQKTRESRPSPCPSSPARSYHSCLDLHLLLHLLFCHIGLSHLHIATSVQMAKRMSTRLRIARSSTPHSRRKEAVPPYCTVAVSSRRFSSLLRVWLTIHLLACRPAVVPVLCGWLTCSCQTASSCSSRWASEQTLGRGTWARHRLQGWCR